MLNLTREEKQILKKVIDDMKNCGLFYGNYDARHGDPHFMYGINTVMEYLAYQVSEEYGEEFCEMFLENMIKSEKRC